MDINNVEPENLIEDAAPKRKLAVSAIVWVIVLLSVAALAIATALLVKYFVISTFVVQGVSMYPTLDGGSGEFDDDNLKNGEILYLNKLAKIDRGDIVVCTPDWDALKDENGSAHSIVKRVIGVGGDQIRVENGATYLNGQLLDEPYAVPFHNGDGEWTIPDGYVFCMGDNRPNSLDCRVYGPIPLDSVVGKCFLIKGVNGKLRKP